MRRCLCCGGKIDDSVLNGWHHSCIKSFFLTDCLPKIEINEDELESIASQNANRRLTVPGVQKKLSIRLDSKEKNGRLTLVGYPTGYILKPEEKDFESLPMMEWLAMGIAKMSGISVVPNALMENGENYAYITKRIDRIIDGNGVKKLAMEDFCQLDSRLTSDKYKGSYERCAKIIMKYSSRAVFDLTELYMRVLVSFAIGNSDMHLKNLSLIETKCGSGEYVLSPAYDILPVNVVMPEDEEEFALTLNGKKKNITKNDLLVFGEHCGLAKTAVLKMMKKIVSMEDKYIGMCEESLLPPGMKKRFIALIKSRCDRLK